VRIVGGKFKGRTLLTFDGDKIRPTSDKARESLFNILQFQIVDTNFLDLFGGTGAVGLEALSRGAKSVYIIDASIDSVRLINKNKQKLNAIDGVTVKHLDAVEFLKSTDKKFDIIFVDPPYKEGYYEKVAPLLYGVLKDGGIAILESETELDINVVGLIVYDNRKYGRTRFTFLKKE
jgi:16S rRNA (guanine(966)-N(2))-methyltransferase RsmD